MADEEICFLLPADIVLLERKASFWLIKIMKIVFWKASLTSTFSWEISDLRCQSQHIPNQAEYKQQLAPKNNALDLKFSMCLKFV